MGMRGVGVLDRPQVALTNLILRGDPGAALRSITSPYTLSPEEMQDFKDRLGLNKGYLGHVIDAVTDPVVLVGALFSLKYPVPSLRGIKEFSDTVKAGAKTPYLGISRKVLSALEIFRDKPDITNALDEWVMYGHQFKSNHLGALGDLMKTYEGKVGRELSDLDKHVTVMTLAGMGKEYPLAMARYKLKSPIDPGKLKAATSPELAEFIRGMEKWRDGVFEDMFVRHPDMAPEIAEALSKKGATLSKKNLDDIRRGVYDIPEDVKKKIRGSEKLRNLVHQYKTGGAIEPGDVRLGVGGYEEDYWPQQLPRDVKKFSDFVSELLQISRGSKESLGRVAGRKAAQTVSMNVMERSGQMLPDPRGLQRFPELLDQANFDKMVSYIEKAEGGIAPWDTDFNNVLTRYVHSMGATYGANRTGAGRRLAEAAEVLAKEGDTRLGILQNDLIPIASGKMDFDRALKAQEWSNKKLRFVNDVLDNPKIAPYIPKQLDGWLRERLMSDPGPFSLLQVQGSLTRWLGLSTLGGNIGASMQNLTQTLNTAAVIGVEATGQGVGRVFQKGEKYIKARTGGKTVEEALGVAFPEFKEAGLTAAPHVREVFGAPFEAAYGASKTHLLPKGVRKGIDSVQRGLMSVFSGTETFNQLVAFEGASWKAAKEGLAEGGEEAIGLARRVVQMTQYPQGVTSTPMALLKLNPIVKQFLTYPFKTLGFLGSTGTTLGSGELAGWGGRNWGVLGRAMLLGGLAYHTGEAFGIDLSGSLLLGGVPAPQEGDAFYPFPFVPPAIGIAGAVGQDVFSGKIEKTKYALPLLVPGGVALSRVAGYLSPQLAGLIGRRYVDWENMTPDGRYGVYTVQEGQPTLIGYETGPQLLLQGLGLPGAGEPEKERDAVKWLISNRDRILQHKREYLDAFVRNDGQGIVAAREKFQRAYPQIAGGIEGVVKPRDLEMMSLRRNVARLERVLDTLPVEARPQFAQMIQSAVVNQGSRFLGLDPQNLQGGTIRSRVRDSFTTGIGDAQARFGFSPTSSERVGSKVIPELGG